MKKTTLVISILVLILTGIIFVSCDSKKEITPSSEFAPYVNAYTGGMISLKSTIKIEFSQPLSSVELNMDIPKELFNFKPSIRGKAHWINNKLIEFVPDSGQLKQGTLYNATFRLNEVLEVKKELSKFKFSFRVVAQNFALDILSIDITSENINSATLVGQLDFSDQLPPDKVKKLISLKVGSKKLDDFEIKANDNGKRFVLTIPRISRGEEDKTLKITVAGNGIGVDKKIEESVVIPALKPFKALYAKMRPEADGIEIAFSEPISDEQDLKGLVETTGVSSPTFQVQDNKINVFFEEEKSGNLSIKIAHGIRSQSGSVLAESSTFALNDESLKPNVSISVVGNILPDSKQLLLPFRAVNLKAVDLKIIRIYENNILAFLQNNSLSGDSEIKRFGRLIYKQTLRLDTDPSKDLHAWEDYSVDLANIIKQEPGSIYRVELTFKQSYSTYSCGGGAEEVTSSVLSDDLIKVDSGELSEEEEEVWNNSTSYYSDNEGIDWNIYKWEERDNPCKPSYYMNSERMASYNVLASNIGIIAKMNSNKKIWVTVNNILDTNPIKEAEVKVYNFQLQLIGSGKTDAEGFAVMDLKGKPFAVVAQQGSQKSYLKVMDGEEKSLSRFDIGGQEIKKGLKGYIYGERGVWRPGDTLHIGFIMEDKLSKIPNSYPVSLEVYNPKGQFYSKQVSASGLNGFYIFHVPTKAEDPTGLWNAYIKAGGATFHKTLRIETIQPNRLKINLTVPSNRIDAALGNFPATLSSSWLTGANAGNLKAKVEMTVSQTNTQFKGYEKYLFNNPASTFTSSQSKVFEGNLNAEGKANFPFKIPQAKNAPGMLQSTIICRIFEPGGNASIYTHTMPFSPFNSYVGINLNEKDGESYIETNSRHPFNVITLSADGKPVNRSNLSYKIYKLNWSWWWESRSESFDSYINNTSITPVFSGLLNTIGGKASINFQVDYPEWGRYLVYVKDPESGHATGGIVYVDWPSWRGRSSKSDPDGATMLSFSTDKSSYEIGEEVTVYIPATPRGRALVALENGASVLKKEWITATGKGDVQYKFKVTEDMVPNFYVHISLLQPHEQTLNDMPIRMYGVIPVLVTNKNSHLEPQITMQDVLRPEKEFEVRVKEKQGKSMTYTLAIVDDGLLDLTNFKTPDAWAEFYTREALGIRTWDLYDQVVGAFGGKYTPLFSVGGDEAGKPANHKANRFKPIVKYLGPYALGKGKMNTHKIKLPMYVGSVRVMVVAGQEGAYGKVEKTVPVRSPLMVLSTLPRVVSIGEEIQLPVNIFAMENTVKSVFVKVETSGKIQLKNGGTKTVNFSKPGDLVSFFDLEIGKSTGVETVKITASGGGHTATETIEIEVRNPNPPIIASQDGLLSPGTEREFSYQLLESSKENWVKLEVSRMPSVDLNRRFDYLESYEHCCTEQLVSKAFPLLYIDQFKELTEKELELTKKNIREAIRLLYARQLQGGGFVCWPGQLSPTDWICSYAGHFLCEARQKGFEVNESVINKWKSYQRSTAQNWTYEYNKSKSRYLFSQEDLQQAYRLYTLALAGSPESGSMNRMKELKTISQQARWRLAAAYALAGKKSAANELIFNIDPVVKIYELNNDTYGSSYRDESMILETLVLLDNTKKAFEQAKKVSENLSAENYFNTQTTAYSLLAMGKLSEKIEKGMIEMEWIYNNKPQKAIKTNKAISQINIPVNVLSGNLKIKNVGKGDLYVVLTSKTKPVRDTLPLIANNLKLNIDYTNLDGKSIDVDRIRQGTDFIASVTVSNISGTTNYTDLALTHIIPSGWEIFNERMVNPSGEVATTAGQTKQQYTFKDIRDDRIFTYFDLPLRTSKKFQVRLLAAYAGRYILPAVQCEAMYNTDVQARTKSIWTDVLK